MVSGAKHQGGIGCNASWGACNFPFAGSIVCFTVHEKYASLLLECQYLEYHDCVRGIDVVSAIYPTPHVVRKALIMMMVPQRDVMLTGSARSYHG